MGRQLTGHGGQGLKQANVSHVIAQLFRVNGMDSNSLRLAFSNQTKDNICVVIQRLSIIFKSHLE